MKSHANKMSCKHNVVQPTVSLGYLKLTFV